jgi:hypothetical protein
MEEAGITCMAYLLGYMLDAPQFESGRGKILFSSQIFPTGFGAPPSILFSRHWHSFPGVKGRRREADVTLFHLALSLRMGRAIPLLPCKQTWHGQGRLYIYLHAWKFFRLDIFKINVYKCTIQIDQQPDATIF